MPVVPFDKKTLAILTGCVGAMLGALIYLFVLLNLELLPIAIVTGIVGGVLHTYDTDGHGDHVLILRLPSSQ